MFGSPEINPDLYYGQDFLERIMFNCFAILSLNHIKLYLNIER